MVVTGLTKQILWAPFLSQLLFLTYLLVLSRAPSKVHKFEFLSQGLFMSQPKVKHLVSYKTFSPGYIIWWTGTSRIIHPKQIYYLLFSICSSSCMLNSLPTKLLKYKFSQSQFVTNPTILPWEWFSVLPLPFIPTMAVPCHVLTISNCEFSLLFF